MSTETGRIRWEPRDSGFDGYIGTLTDRVFEIYAPTEDYEPWRLAFILPRIQAQRHPIADDPETVKAEAEHWLEEFVASLDAVFPDESGELREVLRTLRCVQAGWAFGVPEDGREQWLDLVAAAIRGRQEAAPLSPERKKAER